MDGAPDGLPDDIDALKAVLIIEREKALEVAADLAIARAKTSQDMALIPPQKLRIARLERQLYGQRSERSARLIDQLALAFEELQAEATEDELAAEAAIARTTTVSGFTRQRPERNTFPEDVRLLWWEPATQTRRGRDANIGIAAAPMEGDRDGAGEILLP